MRSGANPDLIFCRHESFENFNESIFGRNCTANDCWCCAASFWGEFFENAKANDKVKQAFLKKENIAWL